MANVLAHDKHAWHVFGGKRCQQRAVLKVEELRDPVFANENKSLVGSDTARHVVPRRHKVVQRPAAK